MDSVSRLVAIFLLAAVACCTHLNAAEPKNSTYHLFLMMVPDSKIEALRNQTRVARQEDSDVGTDGGSDVGTDAATDVATGVVTPPVGGVATPDGQQSATYVGQIVGGVLQGNIREVLAGTAQFLPAGSIRESFGGVLINALAPVLNRIFLDVTQSVAQRFNQNETTPNPNPSQNINSNNNQYQQQTVNNLDRKPTFSQPRPQLQHQYNNFNQFELPRSPPTPPPYRNE